MARGEEGEKEGEKKGQGEEKGEGERKGRRRRGRRGWVIDERREGKKKRRYGKMREHGEGEG